MRRIWNEKIISTFLIITLFLSFSMETIALNTITYDCNLQTEELYVETLSNGYTIETIVYNQCSALSPLSTTKTVSGYKKSTLKNSDGDILWIFTLNGTFKVTTGTSATCTSVTYSTSNIASGWNLDSVSTSKSSNKAYADFVFKHKTLFITTQTVERSLTLTCDPNGNLS